MRTVRTYWLFRSFWKLFWKFWILETKHLQICFLEGVLVLQNPSNRLCLLAFGVLYL